MPVYTRSTFGTDGLAQPIGMVADYGHDSLARDQSGPSVGLQQQKQPTPKEVRIAALQQAAAMVDAQIDTHKKEIARISPGGGTPRPRGTPQPRRPTMGPNAGASASSRPRAASVGRARDGPSPSPRSTPRRKAPATATRPSPVPMLDLNNESIGSVIADSITGALAKQKTGPFIAPAAAKHLKTNLDVEHRASFKSSVVNKSGLADRRVHEVLAIKYKNHEDYLYQLNQLGLKGVDERLAATIYECLKEDEPYVDLLIAATEQSAVLAASGRLIFDWIDAETQQGMRDDPATLKATFDATPFFSAEASIAQNKLQGVKLLKAIEALPLKYTCDVYDKAELVLTKIPMHCRDEHWARDLSLELRKAKRARGEAPSLTDMCDTITDELKTAQPSPSANAASGRADKDKAPKVGARAQRYAGKVVTGTMGQWTGPERSFAFIKMDGDSGNDLFVHQSSIEGDKPKKGDKVKFQIITEKRKGELRERADKVSLITTEPITPVANAAAVQTEDDGNGDGDSDNDSDDGWGCPPTHYRAIVK